MRILVAVWRIAVLALLVGITLQLQRLDRVLIAPAPAPSAGPTAAARAPVPAKSRAQVEWEQNNERLRRRFEEQLFGPDEAKRLIEERNASATKMPPPK